MDAHTKFLQGMNAAATPRKLPNFNDLTVSARASVLNEELGAYGDDELDRLAYDTANLVKSRLAGFQPHLAANLQRRDVNIILLVLGFDMSAIDLIIKSVMIHLKGK